MRHRLALFTVLLAGFLIPPGLADPMPEVTLEETKPPSQKLKRESLRVRSQVTAEEAEPTPQDPKPENLRIRSQFAEGETEPLSASAEGELTLDQVLDRVRNNHPKLFSADLERRISGAKLLEKQGAFDPGISLETDYLRYNDFINRGKVSKTFDNDLSFSWLTRSGLRLMTGARYNTGEVKPPLYPTGDAGEYYVGASMPLMRGFRINERVAAEMQAEIGIPLADAAYTETRISILLQAAFAYWNWAIGERKVAVARNILGLAQVRYEAIQDRVNEGDLPRIDVVEAEQEVKRRQGFVVRAKREYEKQVFRLSRYLWEPGGMPSPLPQNTQIPTEFPRPVAFTDDDWMEGRNASLEKRPELKSLNLQKELTEVDRKFAKNQILPVMDLFATPGYDTGGNAIGPTLKAGVVLVVPLRQRTARGLIAAAEFKIQQLDMEQRLLLQQVLLEVDDAVSAINAAYQQYKAAEQEYQLAQELEQAERDLFDYGDSTLFLVNQRERATAEAAMKLLDLEAEYHQAKVTFLAATGEL